jgi:hypothetical protein
VDQSRAFEITKQEVLTAYKKVKANKGSAGCDGKTIEGFDKDVKIIFIRFGIDCLQDAIFHSQ